LINLAEFEISPKLREYGFTKITVEESVLKLQYKDQDIVVTVYKDSPTKTLDELDKKLDRAVVQVKEAVKLLISSQWSEKILDAKDIHKRNNTSEDSSNSELVLQTAKQEIRKLFVDEFQVAYAAIPISNSNDTHLEVVSLCSKRFRNWLARILHKKLNTVFGSQSLIDAIGILSAEAEFDGESINLNLRVAGKQEFGTNNNLMTWYYDLTNQKWEFIEITSKDWKVVNDRILFRRYSNQLPQVYPSRDYSPDIFDKFIKLVLNKNIKEENRKDYELLLECYVISLFIPDIAKPVLMPYGHQGSAKSTLMDLIKMLVDPCRVNTLSFPRDKNELIQQLSHNYTAFYDNVSRLSGWISDELCRAVSGSGSTVRKLYTDDDDIIRRFRRCIAINGINLAATNADLLDRGLMFPLERIQKKDRRKEEDIKKEFEKMIPQLLGYILDMLVKVLKFRKDNPHFTLEEHPRMADWSQYGEIIARCMGFQENEFIEAYNRNIKLQTDEIIESSQIATCLVYMMFTKYGDAGDNNIPEWSGSASALLGELVSVADTEALNIDTKNRYWPKHPNWLSRQLNEIAPALKDAGLEIEFLKNQGPKKLKIIKIRKVSSAQAI